MPPYAILALLGAVGYSLGSLFNKQAMEGGCGAFRVTAFTIWATALLLIPFAFLYPEPPPLHLWIQPLVAGICFSIGSFFFILALHTGDLRIVAPITGAKPILNALLVWALLGVSVPAGVWIACALTAIALLVLRTPNVSTSHSFLRTAIITLLSSLSFAFCDTCFQQWAANWGVLRFAAITFSASATTIFVLTPFFATPWKQISCTAKRHLLTGAVLCAAPGLCIGLALGRYGHAPEVNVVYSTRALLSILTVRFLGRWIGSSEHKAPRHVLLRRLAGTVILMAALMLVIFGAK